VRGRAVGDDAAIEPDGGAYSAGLIRGAAVITRGEARGHDMWIDETMIKQVSLAINAAGQGVKSRFTHPSLSGDGLGHGLGRYRKASVDGDIVRADLHVFESAHKTPDGDLADYVLTLAREDPESFGNSIAFEPDIGAEEEFRGKHSDEDGIFQSPDPDNTKGYAHVRLFDLRAVDAVDEPAANPDGLFHRGDEIAFLADGWLEYVLGLSGERPAEQLFGIDDNRIRAYVARYFERTGLVVCTAKPEGPTPETKAEMLEALVSDARRLMG